MYKVTFPPPREVYLVVKRGRAYHGCEEYRVEKREAISSVGKGEGDGNFEKKIKIFNNGDGDKYQVVGNFLQHWKKGKRN